MSAALSTQGSGRSGRDQSTITPRGVVTPTWIGAARSLEGAFTSGRGGGSRPTALQEIKPDHVDFRRRTLCRLAVNYESALGTVRLTGVLGGLEQRRCRFEQPRDPRSTGLFRRLVREALSKIAVENGGPNLKQKMSAPL